MRNRNEILGLGAAVIILIASAALLWPSIPSETTSEALHEHKDVCSISSPVEVSLEVLEDYGNSARIRVNVLSRIAMDNVQLNLSSVHATCEMPAIPLSLAAGEEISKELVVCFPCGCAEVSVSLIGSTVTGAPVAHAHGVKLGAEMPSGPAPSRVVSTPWGGEGVEYEIASK